MVAIGREGSCATKLVEIPLEVNSRREGRAKDWVLIDDDAKLKKSIGSFVNAALRLRLR